MPLALEYRQDGIRPQHLPPPSASHPQSAIVALCRHAIVAGRLPLRDVERVWWLCGRRLFDLVLLVFELEATLLESMKEFKQLRLRRAGQHMGPDLVLPFSIHNVK